MLSILRRGTEIQISCADQAIGTVTVSRNPMHDQHCNLTLELTRYDPSLAGELFQLLRRELGMPLKVTACTMRSLHAFLTAGGFARKRRCWELDVSAKDLISPFCAALPLTTARRGSRLYDACCALLYDHYRTTHAAISPLTATLDEFRTHLPDTILCPPRITPATAPSSKKTSWPTPPPPTPTPSRPSPSPSCTSCSVDTKPSPPNATTATAAP